jgi:hypothetical protein
MEKELKNIFLEMCLIREAYPDSLLGDNYLCKDMFNEIIKKVGIEKYSGILILGDSSLGEVHFICPFCNGVCDIDEFNLYDCDVNTAVDCDCGECYILCCKTDFIYHNLSVFRCDAPGCLEKINYCDIKHNHTFLKNFNKNWNYYDYYRVYLIKISHYKNTDSYLTVEKDGYTKLDKSVYKFSEIRYNDIDTLSSCYYIYYKGCCENCKKNYDEYLDGD